MYLQKDAAMKRRSARIVVIMCYGACAAITPLLPACSVLVAQGTTRTATTVVHNAEPTRTNFAMAPLTFDVHDATRTVDVQFTTTATMLCKATEIYQRDTGSIGTVIDLGVVPLVTLLVGIVVIARDEPSCGDDAYTGLCEFGKSGDGLLAAIPAVAAFAVGGLSALIASTTWPDREERALPELPCEQQPTAPYAATVDGYARSTRFSPNTSFTITDIPFDAIYAYAMIVVRSEHGDEITRIGIIDAFPSLASHAKQ